MGEVIKEARMSGIRPMPIERLLVYLGYDMNSPPVAAQGKQSQGEQKPTDAAQANACPG